MYGSAPAGQSSDNVVTLEATWELFELHESITNLTAHVSPGWPTDADTSVRFEDICYRTQLGACGFDGCVSFVDPRSCS